jgi:serine/threonine-protein kinase
MAYVDGESLGVRLAREGAWPIDRAVRILRDVADALAYAHARGVVHRDIKPDNILVDRASGRPMVTDFGIARAAAGETRLTVTGVAVGTPAYMSPEQALGEREIDGRSDLYSLAVVGYHLLTGETPFKAVNTPAMLVKHVSERPRPVRERRPDVPAYLAVAIDRALSKRPEDRWTDAAEFRDALDGAQMSPRRKLAEAAPEPAPEIQIAGSPAPVPGMLPPMPAFPAPPPGLSGGELRRWYKTQRRLVIAEHQAALQERARVIGMRIEHHGDFDERPLEDRVVAFRRSVMAWMGWSALFFGVNAMAGGHVWFWIPSAFMFLNVLRRGGSIWSDGVGPIDAFKKGIRAKLRAQRGESQPLGGLPAPAASPIRPRETPEQYAAQIATAEVLAGPHGEAVRRAAEDRVLMREIAAGLRPIEREMIPDIGPTVDALAQRVGALATTLHRLDGDVSGASLGSLDQRIAALETETPTAERERRLGLLQRQRTSLRDLLERRRSLDDQMESAVLMLQNLKLDMLKFRSSGVGSAIEDQTSATQEARALSREIGHVVQAAEELRKI